MDKFGVIDVENVDFSKLSLSKPKSFTAKTGQVNGLKTVFINYEGAKKLLVRLPLMTAPFGISEPSAENAKPGSNWNIQLSFGSKDPESDENQASNWKFWKNLESLVEKEAQENPKDYLGKSKFSQEIFDERFKNGRSIRLSYGKDGELTDYPPKLRVTIKRNDNGEFLINGLFDAQTKKPIALTNETLHENIRNGTQVKCVVSLDKIWISSIGFGISCSLFQGRVYNNNFIFSHDLCGDDEALTFTKRGREDEVEEAQEEEPCKKKLNLAEFLAEEASC